MENGYTKEEMKMIDETKKILNDDSIRVTATTVRVPVKYGHSVSINIEFENAFELEKVFELLQNADGIIVQDNLEKFIYPMPINAEGTDKVYVGRIRRDYSIDNGLNLWVVADNTRKGAATNAVQIAELLIKNLK
jgi:aspartate-semialdehyde dehydrogenase